MLKLNYFHRFSWCIIEFKSKTAAISEWDSQIIIPDGDTYAMLISVHKFKKIQFLFPFQ